MKTSHLPLQAEKDIKRMEEEIESLRDDKAIYKKRGDSLAAELHIWKHRADLMWKYMNSGYTYPDALLYAKAFCLIEPEAKEAESWFRE